jgi:hypothetical protein
MTKTAQPMRVLMNAKISGTGQPGNHPGVNGPKPSVACATWLTIAIQSQDRDIPLYPQRTEVPNEFRSIKGNMNRETQYRCTRVFRSLVPATLTVYAAIINVFSESPSVNQ